jgi:hypothetical protein
MKMSLEDIDPNRGLIQMPLPGGGPLISTCPDVPGVYFDANGVRCSDDMAASAGFDVQADKVRQRIATAKAEAGQRIEAQFADEQKRIDGLSDEDLAKELAGDAGGDGDKDDDGSPFVEENAGGEPRVARTVQDGPIKVMEYSATAPQGWTVGIRGSDEVLGAELSQDDAITLLLEE